MTYQWRRADTDTWATIPTPNVVYAVGGGAVAWPVARRDGAFPSLTWNVEATLAAANGGTPLDGPVQVRAVFTGSPGGATSPINFTFDRNLASAAATEVGPGSVNLLTGSLTLSDTDVSVDSYGSDLTVTRTYSTRQANIADPMFGPGWTSSVSLDDAEADYTSLTVTGSLVRVGLPDGDTIGFTTAAITATGATFRSEVGLEDLSLTYTTNGDFYTLRDLDGNVVTFTRAANAPVGQYLPTAVTTPGSGQTTTYIWEKVTVDGREVLRPVRVLAPVPVGVDCNLGLVRGCRALSFSYATTTTATGTNPDQWGDYLGRVKEISFTAWDPDANPPAVRTVVLARYTYDTTGRLRAAWDPRLDYTDGGATRHLWDTYAYDADGVITTLTPAGQEPWQFTYTTIPGDPGTGRLAQVSRSALDAGTARTTVVYRVPVSGTGAPFDLSYNQTRRWGQDQPPADATAVFPATQIPDGNPAAGQLPSSYERATVTYLDANGRTVNTAAPGGHIASTWYDNFGNMVQTLTAANRSWALDTDPNDTPEDEAYRAWQTATLQFYDADGQRLAWVLEPEHSIALPTGEVVSGWLVTHHVYDQGAPTGGPFHLVTTTETFAEYYDNAGNIREGTKRVIRTAYDWTLRQATSVTIDPGGLNLTTRTAYDTTTGLVISTTTPGGGTGDTTPSTRRTIYYTTAANTTYPECGNRPEWANLVCRVQPGGQPASGPELPTNVTTYDILNQPRTITEKTSAGSLRTTETTYDSAGRAATVKTTAVSGMGEPIPTTRTIYDPATGQPIETQSLDAAGNVTARVIRAFDRLGRQTGYTDGDGNTATTRYDLLSRPVETTDSKATRTYRYDTGSERRGLLTELTDSQAGTFTADYDADGRLIRETWPNGITAVRTFDQAGVENSISYVKSNCGGTGVECRLFSEEAIPNIHGQTLLDYSTFSSQTYGYDAASRLTSVADTVDTCTTRTYRFDNATNRTTHATYGPTANGGCQTTTAAASRTWTYDSADRVNTTGSTYDPLGRTTRVPAADTGSASGGDLTATYHHNDLVRSITHNGRTTTYTLDINVERIRAWHDTTSNLTRRNHYDDDADSPVWTDEGNNQYTRPVSGASGMAGIYTSADNQTRWQITNLHGDLVATIHGNDTGLSETEEFTEYGAPRDPQQTGGRRYGWLGAHQRAADTPTGVVLMGVRLYNPTTGRFLQDDPITGGSCNAYEYTCGDPINNEDLDGKCAICRGAWGAARELWRGGGKRFSRWAWNKVGKRASKFAWDKILRPGFGGYGRSLGRSITRFYSWVRRPLAGVAVGIKLGKKVHIRCRRFPNTGGWGCDVRWKGNRVFGVHCHPIKYTRFPCHYHRRPGIGRHRPWDGGW